jgi:hypothetical protein
MNLVSSMRVFLRARGHTQSFSREPLRRAVGSTLLVRESDTYPQLHWAVFSRLLEMADSVERGDAEAARKALAMAVAIQAEMLSVGGDKPSVSESPDPERVEDG